jgi:biotin carboxyl carrier protein
VSYELRHGDRSCVAEVARIHGERLRVDIDGRSVELQAHYSTDGLLLLLIDGRSYEVSVQHGDPMTIGVNNETVLVRVRDERERTFDLLGEAAGSSGPAQVASPMPGRVVDVLVELGQAVEEGDPVVVVEAMKMENALTATRSGVVRSIRAAVGDSVDGGQSLIEIQGESE